MKPEQTCAKCGIEKQIADTMDVISRMEEPNRSEALKSYLHQLNVILNKPFVSILEQNKK